MIINAIIVEDSRLARRELTELLKIHPEINIIDEAEHIEKAKILIETLRPDLVFLDINMPGGSGFQLLEKLIICPNVIFTTAYDEHAVKAFEYNALDYLLKPINPKRLAQSVSKIINKICVLNELKVGDSVNSSKKIFVKDGDKCWLVSHVKIRYLESCGNYVKIHFEKNQPLYYKSLNKIEEILDRHLFVRASRQFIINKNYISKVDDSGEKGLSLTMDDERIIAISRRNISQVKKITAIVIK